MNKKSKVLDASIIICTYNRKRKLRECLTSIFAVDYPKDNFEVIVVDGGSNDGTEDLLKEFPQIRFTKERRRGLASARNQGARLARGRIVVYTDDDCIVDEKWLAQLIDGFKVSNSIAGVGGPVCPQQSELIPSKLMVRPALGLYDEGYKTKYVSLLITSNAAFKREIFERMEFNENLGVTRKGKLLLSGEDIEFCRAVTASGFKILYTPFAKVYHQIGAERVKVPYILKHAVHNGLSLTRILLKNNKSRVWAVRYSMGRLVQSLFSAILNRSFSSCYNLVYSISGLFFCATCADIALLGR